MQQKSENRSRSCKRLKDRNDVMEWMKQMLPDPFQYKGITGAAYDEQIREFEFCSRPLWAIFSLIASGEYEQTTVDPFLKRIKAGMKPGTRWTYPEPTTARRQAAVEMAVYGYGLLCCGEQLLACFDKEEKERFAQWLYMVNDITFPRGNWYFFLLIINYGLKANNLPYNQEKIDFACREIESFYVGDGWYQDGKSSQRDYYIPFAFQFYSLILERYCPEHELQCVKERSMDFEQDFRYWIDHQGRSLPFGRSLTYRFAHSCYWSACAVSGIHRTELGEIKEILLGNLNFWAEQDILQDGILSIGYGYPSLIMSEDYNAPGSPMWAFKSFVILSLPSDHEFWMTEQKPVILKETIRCEKSPGFLMVAGRNHHYGLSVLQFSDAPILQHMSKYGKFCYSTAFGWNCSRDVEGIDRFAVDSALALSVKGTGQFAGRGRIEASKVYQTYGYSRWNYGTIAAVESWLIPLDEDYHVRIHRIRTALELETYEGAFPVFGWNPKFCAPVADQTGILLFHRNMSSGIWDISGDRKPETVLQNPNTNIYDCERNAVPALKGTADPKEETVYACLVYGNPQTAAPQEETASRPIVIFQGKCIRTAFREIILKEF